MRSVATKDRLKYMNQRRETALEFFSYFINYVVLDAQCTIVHPVQ